MSKKVILLGLNELNFDYIKHYVDQGLLPSFGKLIKEHGLVETTSESEYHLLEPWIQWVTVHTGKTYAEHQVYRLGDIVEREDLSQIFEELEKEGKAVAAVSPFNAANKLKNPAFFVPDPWTKTKVSGGFLTRKLYEGVHQSVNENASSKLSISTLLAIGASVVTNVSPSRWPHYLSAFMNRKKPGYKAIILDSLLSDVFLSLWKKKKPDFANLFLNTGAHVQHHYLFNSAAYTGAIKNPEWYCPKGYDPLIAVLQEYDKTIAKLMKQDVTLILATGLHQNPHEHATYYWRLKEHAAFLKQIGITTYEEVLPRMSRDFLIRHKTEKEASAAQQLLESFVEPQTGKKVFEVDNRGTSLFVELVFDNDITEELSITSAAHNREVANFKSYVAFVAIKNGEHNGIGYLITTGQKPTSKSIPLTAVKQIIKSEVLAKHG